MQGSRKELWVYKQYDDRDLERLSMIMTLYDLSFNNNEFETYMRLLLEGESTENERMQMLNEKRRSTLNEIHFKQIQLDYLDYLGHEIKKSTKNH